MRIALTAIVVSGLCASLRAQIPERPNSHFPDPGITYLPRTWPEGRCRPGQLPSLWPVENAIDLYVTNAPRLGSPLGARIRTARFAKGCDARGYFGMLLVTPWSGSVMPNGHGIRPDGSIRLGRGVECAVSVIPETIVYFAPSYGRTAYDVVLAPRIPNDPWLVGFELFMQVALAPDLNCGPAAPPWLPPRKPGIALVTSDVMRVEIQRA